MKVEKGDVVAVRYTGRLDNGEVFDSNEDGDEALSFRVGAGQVIAGFEDAVLGLAKGESRTTRIDPANAYGVRDPKLIQRIDRELMGGTEVEIGQHLDLEDDKGNVYHADVVDMDDKTVTVDLNHHLAGEALTFDIKVEGIERE